MRFGQVALDAAEGAILAHATKAGDLRLRKSHRLTRADLDALRAAGIEEVVVAMLDPGDVREDEAAGRVAGALVTAGVEVRPPGTGRVNFHAREDGVFTVDGALVDAVNRNDPAITIATLANHAPVRAGQMVATVKIIPFAVPAHALASVSPIVAGRKAFAVHAFAPRRVAMIQTMLPSLKASVLDKTARVTADRLARSGSTVVDEARVPHDADALARAIARANEIADMVMVFGASAMCDPQDVLPDAIRRAGGDVIATGMPVDPGNLLVLGRLDGQPVLGAPGCSRSPKENGFDWVLDRLMAGFDVTADDIACMGVGGLLMEIETRPQPREGLPVSLAVHAVLLAAGRSSRMGGPNKLLARFDGKPLVRRVAEAALGAGIAGLTVVTGHQSERVADALEGLPLRLVHNPEFADGLAGSLKAGIAAVPPAAAGALVLLGDMPEITSAALDRLVAAFGGSRGTAIVRATHGGRHGNPVILPRAVFPMLAGITGDTGARHVIESSAAEVIEVEIGEAATLDVDTPQAMALVGGVVDR